MPRPAGGDSSAIPAWEHSAIQLVYGLEGCLTRPASSALSSDAGSKTDELTTGVVLLHGASGTIHTPHMERLAVLLAGLGVTCVRYTFISSKVENRAAKLKEVLAAVRQIPDTREISRWILAGHSMGARAVCEAALSNPPPGIILFSYPLHPPKQKEKIRDVPLTSLEVPILWVRGTKDDFCSLEVFDGVLPRMQSKLLKVHTVPGGSHSLSVPKKMGGDEAMLEALSATVAAFLACLHAPQAAAAAERRQEAAAINHTSTMPCQQNESSAAPPCCSMAATGPQNKERSSKRSRQCGSKEAAAGGAPPSLDDGSPLTRVNRGNEAAGGSTARRRSCRVVKKR